MVAEAFTVERLTARVSRMSSAGRHADRPAALRGTGKIATKGFGSFMVSPRQARAGFLRARLMLAGPAPQPGTAPAPVA
eukprot:7741378-Pyramimonas_sp.AAC.1